MERLEPPLKLNTICDVMKRKFFFFRVPRKGITEWNSQAFENVFMLEVDCSFGFSKKILDGSRIQSGNFGCLYSYFLHWMLRVLVFQDPFEDDNEKVLSLENPMYKKATDL